MRLAVMITMALSLAVGTASAKTPYHDGTAEVITPTDKNHPLGEIVSGYDFRKAMIRDVHVSDHRLAKIITRDDFTKRVIFVSWRDYFGRTIMIWGFRRCGPNCQAERHCYHYC